MTIRRINAPMLYAEASDRWLRNVSGAMDAARACAAEAAAAFCRAYWQHGRIAALQPMRIVRATHSRMG